MVIFLKLISFLQALIRGIVLLLLFLFIISYVVLWLPELAQAPYISLLVQTSDNISQPINDLITSILPFVSDSSVVDLIKIILFILINLVMKSVSFRMNFYLNYLLQKDALARMRIEKKIPENNSLYQELESKLIEMNASKNEKDSKKLYQEFMELKKKLESMARYMAFLAIDVVDSTGMKSSEEKSLVQVDFLRFKKLIQQNLDKQGCLKSAWTPDGVMACFNTVDDAIKAAQHALINLKEFNKHHKKISRDFIIRCGIHAGIIYYDEQLPMQEMTDQVIDIAGHMQKYAKPGTIAISKTSIKPVDNTAGFVNSDKVVDQLEVYQWEASDKLT
ncbi:Uncharacterised protein [Legionella beliardensis]|uniref:Uncharacterized protein n=1 Tax=Legionella beliardensis TaxID=91822 RepID=A0A378I4H9_9GAMM|nr:hypothetical protein [Legionella beliardensis]STX30117.1 Uncharacterised protein [Legionella beliardensis]